jgi:hypothetical protein
VLAPDALEVNTFINNGQDVININTAAVHTVTYSCEDNQGLPATTVYRRVVVVDHTAPVINMKSNTIIPIDKDDPDDGGALLLFDFLQPTSTIVTCVDECDVNTTITTQLFHTECQGTVQRTRGLVIGIPSTGAPTRSLL